MAAMHEIICDADMLILTARYGSNSHMHTCGVIRMEMREEVIFASSILEIEAVDHEVGAVDPF